MIVREMTQQECVAVLSECTLGRLACARDNHPYVVPVFFAFADKHVYSFSMEGQKVDWMRTNPFVCFQVDEFSTKREWRTVVVYGHYEELTDTPRWTQERDHAWSLLQKHRANWWEPGGLKPTPHAATHLFFRICVESMTGRQATSSA